LHLELDFEDPSSVIESEVRKLCRMVDLEKCTMQFVLNVDKNVKFHSSLTKADLYTAENATVRKDQPEVDIKLDGKFFF
jgi:hypothetical protein